MAHTCANEPTCSHNRRLTEPTVDVMLRYARNGFTETARRTFQHSDVREISTFDGDDSARPWNRNIIIFYFDKRKRPIVFSPSSPLGRAVYTLCVVRIYSGKDRFFFLFSVVDAGSTAAGARAACARTGTHASPVAVYVVSFAPFG